MSGVAAAMRLARRRHRLSQRELAALLGVDRAVVGRWESGRGPAGFDQVVGVLRTLGFGLAVHDLESGAWGQVTDPPEHLVDRGRRRFPAHLDETEGRDPIADWVRYRWSVNPWCPDWSYRMDPDRRAELREIREGARTWPRVRTSEDLVPYPEDTWTGEEPGSPDVA